MKQGVESRARSAAQKFIKEFALDDDAELVQDRLADIITRSMKIAIDIEKNRLFEREFGNIHGKPEQDAL